MLVALKGVHYQITEETHDSSKQLIIYTNLEEIAHSIRELSRVPTPSWQDLLNGYNPYADYQKAIAALYQTAL